MLRIRAPVVDDAKTLARLCKAPEWKPHKDAWQKACSAYLLAGGDPWVVTPAGFDDEVAAAQRKLYDTRKNSGAIARIRDTPSLRCCPVCGSSSTGTLDHYLPRAVYPEFSIFSANLIPACFHCNSGGKGARTVGDAVHERFLHPYFDDDADHPIWRISFLAPLEAVRFQAVAMPGLDPVIAARVAFHLRYVLCDEFDRWIDMEWAGLPQRVRNRLEDLEEISPNAAALEVKRQLRDAQGSAGLNSWPAAFLRGVLADSTVLAHVALEASGLTAEPLP